MSSIVVSGEKVIACPIDVVCSQFVDMGHQEDRKDLEERGYPRG